VPLHYSRTTPAPLVLNLHGSGSNAPEQEQFSGIDATADAEGFVVAYPDGSIPVDLLGVPGFDWNVPGEPLVGGESVPAHSVSDLSFLTSLPALLAQRVCLDMSRVYVTGFSGGARMASVLGCDAPTVFAAIAAVSGLQFPAHCTTGRSMPVIAFHGTADPVDPYDGKGGQKYWTSSVPSSAKAWAAHDGCAATPRSTNPVRDVKLTSWSSCASASAVELYSLVGDGHTWPGGVALPAALRRYFGATAKDVDADALIWSFFAGHRS
jgi:polyhydroxybutyrate depolymerase